MSIFNRLEFNETEELEIELNIPTGSSISSLTLTDINGTATNDLKDYLDEDNSMVIQDYDPEGEATEDFYLENLNKKLWLVSVAITASGVSTTYTKIIYNHKYLVENILPIANKELCGCEVPRGLIDFILRYNALNFAIEDNNWTLAKKYWAYCDAVNTALCPISNCSDNQCCCCNG